MNDFEKWFYTEDAEKFGLYPDMHSARAAWNYQETKLKEMDEVIKMQDADLRKYEKQIESLREQLNNIEACYIEKKKQVEELQKTNISLEAGLRKNSKNKQKLLGKNNELQKRIDEALEDLEYPTAPWDETIASVIRVLRGDHE